MGLVTNQVSAPGSNPTGSALGSITSSLQTYIVSPLAAFGLGGFVFNSEGEDMVNLSSDVTDHYAEDNVFMHDHIAIKPKRITLKGYVGELVYNGQGSSQNSLLNQVPQKLIAATAFLPAITSAATQLQQAASNPSNVSFASAIGTSSNIYALVKNILGAFGNTKNQQNAYNYFRALWQSGTIMSVQTPWEFMTSMVIENVVALQGEESIYISDFAVSYKEIRLAQTMTTAYSQGNSGTAAANTGATAALGVANNAVMQAGVAAAQAANTVNQGLTPGAVLPISSLPGVQSVMTGVSGIAKSLFSYGAK